MSLLRKPMTSNLDLEDACRQLHIPLKAIRYKDQLHQLPTTWRDKSAFLVNMQSSGMGPGTHWIALFFPGSSLTHPNCFYFDSFGIEPPMEVIDFAKRCGYKHMINSTKEIQSLDEGYCGQFCILFLQAMSSYKRPDLAHRYQRFLNSFKTIL